MTDPRDPSDPVSLARKLSAPELIKRFYKRAELSEEEGKYYLLLDGRRAHTPTKNRIFSPFQTLATALVEEWNKQGERIDPTAMPVTRLVNSAIDGVAPRIDDVRRDIEAYAGTDALCYRAEEPEGLVAEQNRHWDPVLAWADERLGARFTLACGIVPVDQPAEALEAVRRLLAEVDEPFRIAGLHVATTITGSAILALALHSGEFDDDALWAAAHVDEDWNIRQWGEDAEAKAGRTKRYLDFKAAALAIRGE
ncbi:MAG TPA: ATP12 family protein [Afifellaceae bacterium]|nr:ATP12 family protein [Afifellaceae bacterium]